MEETCYNEEESGYQESENVWHLREEHRVASNALRKRSVPRKIPSSPDQEKTTMSSGAAVSSTVRPGLIHRNTDPFPMREFTKSVVWACEPENGEEQKEEEQEEQEELVVKSNWATISEEESVIKKCNLNEETFLVSSFALANRRLSLPLSRIEHSWSMGRTVRDEVDDIETISNNLERSHPVSLKLMELSHSTMEKKKRRQSAFAMRRPSACVCEDMNKYLSKRRMSELPALSSLATRRRSNVRHMVSVPVGLKRKASRSTDHHESSSSRAKNEMLATLSVSSWLDKISPCHQETSRRKSCHTGFGMMALKKKEEKRVMVAHEILQTEKNYIKALETLNEVFVEPLNNSSIIPAKDMRIMFPKQLHDMKYGHVKFMNELNERLNNWKWQGFLGDIFAKLGNSYHINFMTVYSEYVKNFPKSIAVLNKYSRNSQKFRKLIEKCNNDPRCERLNIYAFLLTPIQRLPRYVLLLQQLSKYTETNHPDSFNIEISLKKMIDTINMLNNSIQTSTRIARNTAYVSRRRRKRPIFKTKEPVNSELTSPRKSSDESELSEASALDSLPADQHRSSDYGSLSNGESTSEATSPVPSSGSSSKGNIFKVILRNNSESRKSKTRPLSSTEVEIYHRKSERLSADIPEHGVLKRSVSRDHLGSFLRQKFDNLRGKHRSLEKVDDCKINLFEAGYGEESFCKEESKLTSCKSESNLLGEKKTTLDFRSRSATESHRYLHSRSHCGNDDSEDSDSVTRRNFDCADTNSNDNDDRTSHHRLEAVGGELNKDCQSKEINDKKTRRRKVSKQNSFTNVVKHFFVSKSRSSSIEVQKP